MTLPNKIKEEIENYVHENFLDLTDEIRLMCVEKFLKEKGIKDCQAIWNLKTNLLNITYKPDLEIKNIIVTIKMAP